jgi:hypothetical protein
MKTLSAVFVVAAAIALAGCPGSTVQPLPPGGGQGTYVGAFTDETEVFMLGSFELEIDDVGVIEGSGLLQGREVTINGVLSGDEVDAYLDDLITHRGGRFTGYRTGVGYDGEFRIDRDPGETDLEGYWTCVPAN